jgi:hypothetical protein
MTDPKILAKAIQAAAEAEEQRKKQQRAALGEFVGRLLIPDERTRDDRGRFTEKEPGDVS